MKKYIVYLIFVALMIASFFISGLFFVSSGIVNFDDGFDNEQSIRILAELDEIPFINIEPYRITFYSRGELVEVGEGVLIFASYGGEEERFVYEGGDFELEEGKWFRIYYNYLPEGGKKIERIEGFDLRG